MNQSYQYMASRQYKIVIHEDPVYSFVFLIHSISYILTTQRHILNISLWVLQYILTNMRSKVLKCEGGKYSNIELRTPLVICMQVSTYQTQRVPSTKDTVFVQLLSELSVCSWRLLPLHPGFQYMHTPQLF